MYLTEIELPRKLSMDMQIPFSVPPDLEDPTPFVAEVNKFIEDNELLEMGNVKSTVEGELQVNGTMNDIVVNVELESDVSDKQFFIDGVYQEDIGKYIF